MTGGPANLPPPIDRWLAVVAADRPPGETAVIEGACRFRRGGRGPWLPIQARMSHRLGRNHIVDLRVGLGPVTLVRGLDGYLDGVGFSRVGSTLQMGPEIDQASALFMWCEALLFPTAWRERSDLRWEAVDDVSALVYLPIGTSPDAARLFFDRTTGLPARFAAARFKGVGAPKVEWLIDYAGWRVTQDGVRLPSDVTVRWADEPGPWFRMRIERANPGGDISDALARAQAMLRDRDAARRS